MKQKSIAWLVCLCLAAGLLAGCAGPGGSSAIAGSSAAASSQAQSSLQTADQDAASVPAGAVTFTDALGRTVTADHPQRVATLLGSFTDIWMLAGGSVTATVQDSWESFDLPLAEDTVSLGSLTAPDAERLVASKPDLVLASAKLDADLALQDVLEQAGIPVAYFDVSDFDAYLKMLDICTRITGQTDRYDTYGTQVGRQIDAAVARADGSCPTVLYLRAAAGRVEAKKSDGNVGAEMLRDLGSVNIADTDAALAGTLSMEAILAADPHDIFITSLSDDSDAAVAALTEDPAWQSLTAVKEDRVYFLDKRLYNAKPNARWGEAYAHLADILYGKENT